MLRHRKLKNQWLLIPILIMLILLSGSFLFKKHNYYHRENVYFVSPVLVTKRPTEASLSMAPVYSYVTKSLAELGKMDEINKHVLFINQVPYCGGEVIVLLLQKLQGFNNYRHVRLKGNIGGKLTKLEQEEFIDNLYNIIRNKAVPLSFDQQIHFINFTTFDKQSPTFVNIIRDPADKILSRSYYGDKRKTNLIECLEKKKTKCFNNDLTIPYFCGYDDRCLTNPDWALQIAKENVEKYYPVVGVVDELNTTLEVFEHKIPFYFKGAQEMYQKHISDKFKPKKRNKQLLGDIKRIKKILAHEFEFYNWVKSRLFQQLQILYGDHH